MKPPHPEGLDPIDRLAALQMAKGEKLLEPELKDAPNILQWRTRPRIKPHLGNTPDLTGRVVGRLTVIGPLAELNTPNHGSKWVVRCSCGEWYETRSSKAINNPKNVDDCCRRCRHMKHVVRHYEYIKNKESHVGT